ncbi:eukaryotic translation initiation factor 3 subunit C-like isoform X4 [Bolinopsis microptera]|uniref:eukaryotic translation initiation factor 3 subunit C-like isoform X4 n=1 Tax=Bolinopsis microptera TaxID=2820187 RepID=UPI003079CC5D
MSSRFFSQLGDSSDDSSSSDSEVEAPVTRQPAARQYSSILEESDEEKRVVRSSKDKRFSEINETIKAIRNHKKIKDITKVQEGFTSLCQIYAKSQSVIAKNGCPRAFIRCIADLETYVTEFWGDKEGRSKLNKINSKALAALRQNVRKYNKDFVTEIGAYNKDPESYEEVIEEDEDEVEKSDDEGVGFAPSSTKIAKKPRTTSSRGDDEEDLDDDSDDMWGDDSEDESSSDDEVPAIGYTAAYFLKSKDDDKKDKPDRKKKAPRQPAKVAVSKEDEGWTTVSGTDKVTKEKPLFEDDAEITVELVNQKIAELSSVRGRRGAKRQKNIETLELLSGVCVSEELGIPILAKCMYYTCLSIFDYNPNMAVCMKVEIWVQLLTTLDKLLTLLEEHREVIFNEGMPEEEENMEDPERPLTVAGSILVIMERADDEFTKLLRNLDPHGTEYVDRLSDEAKLCGLILRVKAELSHRKATHEEMCRTYLREIEHLYYKVDYDGGKDEGPDSSRAKMDALCKYIYRYDSTDRIRTRAMLCHIYHHALHNRWSEGRDLMLMSHLQQSISHADIPTKILHNRTMVQLGLCAFRKGLIQHAHTTLNEIQSSQKSKELLAQGLSTQRMSERNLEQEKIEKQRQIPFHMHINLELLEYSYLTCAMLLEVPHMAAHQFDQRKKLSRTFHYQLRNAEKSPLIGPPDSMREHLVAAAKAMMKADWKTCADTLLAHKIWNLMPHAEEVKAMLRQKIKEESLRTYMFTYSACYDSISPLVLSQMFSLTNAQIHALISKMILNDELKASWDKPTDLLMLHRAESSKLQSLTKQTADKLTYVMDNTEKMLQQGTPFTSKGGSAPSGLPWNSTWSNINKSGGQGNSYNRRGNNYSGNNYSGNNSYSGNRNNNYQGNRGGYQKRNYDSANNAGYNRRTGGNYNNSGYNNYNRKQNYSQNYSQNAY